MSSNASRSQSDSPAFSIPRLELGETWPNREGFSRQAQSRRVIPVVRKFLADGLTPVQAYLTVASGDEGTFLLESADQAGAWSRYSIVGARSVATLTERNGQVHWLGTPPVGVPTGGPALQALADTVELLHTEPVQGMPPLTSGMVGFIGWDAVRQWENIPATGDDELRVPLLSMSLASDLVVFDHKEGTVMLVANAINFDNSDQREEEAYLDACARLDALSQQLGNPASMPVAAFRRVEVDTQNVTPRTSKADYLAAVQRGKEHIVDGDVFQVVLSQRFDTHSPADPVDVYRVLRATNPSPYMYLYRTVDAHGVALDVVGSSPEALVTVHNGSVVMHPIAGSRPRGATAAADQALAEELLADEKECAEHLMLVDLARNDLQRVCQPGSVEVLEYMQVERYSHIMHLVSTVTGNLRGHQTTFNALAATFPAGTLSGAPKIRAMEIIDDLEPSLRGLYGGVVGYLDFSGNMDIAIAIRTALIRGGKGGTAHVQAGAGIVADSRPEAEYQECVNKAAAALGAVLSAGTLHPSSGRGIDGSEDQA